MAGAEDEEGGERLVGVRGGDRVEGGTDDGGIPEFTGQCGIPSVRETVLQSVRERETRGLQGGSCG